MSIVEIGGTEVFWKWPMVGKINMANTNRVHKLSFKRDREKPRHFGPAFVYRIFPSWANDFGYRFPAP